jgi:hypothetical protein
MGIKISEMTADSSVTGVEMIPVSDGGSPKRVTVSQIKDFAVDQIEAIAAASVVSGSDGVYILQSGALKPVDIDVVTQYVLDTMWSKAAEATPTGSCVLPLKKASTEETITLTVLAEYVRTLIEGAILDVSNLSSAGTLTDSDLALVTQTTTGKKVTLGVLATYVLGALDTYLTGLSAVSSPSDTDVFYVIQGGVEKKATWATLKAALGNCSAPATTTENNIPQWSSTQKTLKDGLSLQTTVRASASASDTAVPTEQAVRELADGIVYAQTDIGTDLADSDTTIVDDGGTGATQRKSALTRFWTYVWSKVSGATPKTTPVDADSIGIVDSAASSVVKNLTFADLWTNWGSAKAKTVKLDDFTATDDNTDLDASAAKHGLMPKLDKVKLDTVSTGADVTSASILDEDDMVSNSATKVPTQQSTKAYVDTKFAAAGVDITTAPAKVVGVDADKAIISDSADSGAAKTFALSNLWNYIESKVQGTAAKATGVDADITVIQDSAASFGLREFTLANLFAYIQSKCVALTAKATPVAADSIVIKDSAAPTTLKLSTFTQVWSNIYLASAKLIKLDEFAAPTDVTTLNASTSVHGLAPKVVAPSAGDLNVLGVANGETAYSNKGIFDATAPANVGTAAAGTAVIAARKDHVHAALPYVEVDGTLGTGANADFVPAKLVYNKTCSDSDGDDVIDLHNGTIIGQVVTIYLGTKAGTDNAIITPVTALGYTTISLTSVNHIATLQWQGATVGWAILRTTGAIA